MANDREAVAWQVGWNGTWMNVTEDIYQAAKPHERRALCVVPEDEKPGEPSDDADARRYRWIRAKENNGYSLNNPATIGKFEVGQHVEVGVGRYYWMEQLDAAIDAAMENRSGR